MLRFILLGILSYLVFRTIRNFFLGPPAPKTTTKNNVKTKEENFQQKYKDRIEDADFEELD